MESDLMPEEMGLDGFVAIETANGAGGLVLGLGLLLMVFFIVVYWRLFTKAGFPGWMAIIPIVNLYPLVKIAGLPGWAMIGFFIPFVNLLLALYLPFAHARCFGKSLLFGVGLLFLSVIFYPILAFGSAEFEGC